MPAIHGGAAALKTHLHLSTSFRLFDLRSQRSVHALWRFGPTARTFGVENPSIFRHHIVLINRVKKSTLVQIGLQLYLSTLFCSSTLFLLVLNTTACTMHCNTGAMSFSPKGKNKEIMILQNGYTDKKIIRQLSLFFLRV